MSTKLGTLTLDLVARIGNFTAGMRQASSSAEREMGRASSSVNAMNGMLGKLAATAGAAFSINQIVNYADSYTGLQNRLKLVTASQAELNTAMNDTFGIAQKTASSWDSVAMVYQRFADNADRLNITMAQTSALTETVSKAISVSGGSAASAEAALMQFGQALASGVLRGEEFNSIAEQAPGLLKAIAFGLNTNVGSLRAMAQDGKITGDVLVDALGKAKPYIDDLFGKTDFTIANSFTQLNNAVTQFVGEAGKGSGAAKLLSTSISTLANNLEPIANAGAALAVGLLAKAMIGGMAATTNATYALIAKADASIAERQANITSTQAELASAAAEARSTQITLTNAKATHAQIMAEIQLEQVRLKAQITDQGRMATITRMAQLGRLQAQVALEIAAAETAQASASARLATSQAAVAAATSRMALAKAALMSVFSPMGLAIAATAATFYLLSDSSDEVKESLATQSESVEDLTAKYRELNSVQALTEGLRLRKEIDQQNEAIDDASSSAERYAYFQKEMFKLSGSDYADYQKAITSIKTGASDAGDLLKEMIESGRFSQPQIDKMIEFSAAVAESKNKIAQNNTALKMLSATSSEHTKVTEESLKQLGVQANLVKVATQNFAGMKVQMLETLQAQVELSRLNGASEESITSLNSIISKYSLNQLNASDAVSQFNKVAKIPKDVVQGIQDYAVKTDSAKDSVNKAVIAQKTLAVATGQAKNEIKEQAAEVAGLTEEIKKLLGVNAEGANKSNYLKEMVDLKVDPKLAEMLYEARKASGLIGSGKKLSDDVLKSVLERWKADKGLNKTLEERAKIEERNKKAIEAQGNAMKVNAKVAANAAKYNFASIEAKNNLPKGLISATIMQESKGSIYNSKGGVLTSPSGAQGPAQFMPDTAKRFNVDVTSMKSSAEGVAKYYVRLLDLFDGDLNKAISAYHAGEGNVQRGTNIGPVNRQYVKNIKGYMAGSSGIKFNEEYSSDDWAKEQEKLVMEREKYEKEQAEKQKQLALEVATYKERVNTELADKIKEVNEAGFGEAETKRLTAEYQKRAAIDIQVSEAAHADKISEYSDYLKSEEVLLNESFARRQRDLKLDLTLTVDEYKKASLLLEGERDKELQKARWRALEMRQAMVDQIKGLSAGADNIFAQATMSPQDYDRWSLENDRSNAKADLKNQRVGTEQDIMTSDAYSTDDQRYEALLEAHKEYRDGMAAIDVDYHQRVKDLEVQNYEDKLEVYGMLLSQAGTVWGTMTQMVKDSAGEQSGAYKTMFFMQQAIAIGQAVISTELAAVKALELGPILGIPASALVRGMGYASVGMIAAQTISGMAHDGIDNIPKEGTWLLDKGERVVDSRTNSDLKNYLAEGGGSGGDVYYTQTIHIASDGSATSESDAKQLGKMMENMTLSVIRQEQRQGGLLSK